MSEKATTIDEQLSLLKSRGMIITDEKKAKEYLLDIGYFRLGFYWFPFEKSYPRKFSRNHDFTGGTLLDFAIQLYYFDFDIRNIFLRYMSRIEVNFRTTIVYRVSNTYPNDPYWYVNPDIIKADAINSKEYQKVLRDLKKEQLLINDSKNHNNREYSPAWKALEFMSFGSIVKIYENLLNPHLQCEISNLYGMRSPSQFCNYINTLRKLRNYCAHGKVLYDLNLDVAIGNGPLGYLYNRKTMLSGMYLVFKYILGTISQNRVNDMKSELTTALENIEYEEVKSVILNNSGIRKNII